VSGHRQSTSQSLFFKIELSTQTSIFTNFSFLQKIHEFYRCIQHHLSIYFTICLCFFALSFFFIVIFSKCFHEMFQTKTDSSNGLVSYLIHKCKEKIIKKKVHSPTIQYTICIWRTRSNRESCSLQPSTFTVHVI